MDVELLVLAVGVDGFAGRALRTFVSFLVDEARMGSKIAVGRTSECLWGMSTSYGLSGHSLVLVRNSDGSLPI